MNNVCLRKVLCCLKRYRHLLFDEEGIEKTLNFEIRGSIDYLEVGLNFKERTMRYFESLGTKNFIEIKRCLAKEFQKYLRFITYLEVKMTFS